MRKFILLISFLLVFSLAGCSNASKQNTTAEKNSTKSSSAGNTSATKSDGAANSSSSSDSKTQSSSAAIKPGTLPQLSSTQKSEVNDKLSTTINDIQNSLNSLDDVNDININ